MSRFLEVYEPVEEGFISNIIEAVKKVLKAVWNAIKKVYDFIKSKILAVYEKLKSLLFKRTDGTKQITVTTALPLPAVSEATLVQLKSVVYTKGMFDANTRYAELERRGVELFDSCIDNNPGFNLNELDIWETEVEELVDDYESFILPSREYTFDLDFYKNNFIKYQDPQIYLDNADGMKKAIVTQIEHLDEQFHREVASLQSWQIKGCNRIIGNLKELNGAYVEHQSWFAKETYKFYTDIINELTKRGM